MKGEKKKKTTDAKTRVLAICIVATQRGRYNNSNTSTIGSVCSLNSPAHNARKAYESSTSILIYTLISFF
jgi:hypothetical protein